MQPVCGSEVAGRKAGRADGVAVLADIADIADIVIASTSPGTG